LSATEASPRAVIAAPLRMQDEGRHSARTRGTHAGEVDRAERESHELFSMGAAVVSGNATRHKRPWVQRGQRITSSPVSASMHSTQLSGAVSSVFAAAGGSSGSVEQGAESAASVGPSSMARTMPMVSMATWWLEHNP
jgi:hypothetical protein